MLRLLLAGALLAPAVAFAQTAPDSELTERLSSGTPEEQKQALELVLTRSQGVASVELFLASAAALQQGRVEDAGFLLYAAQLRARVDMGRFPPKEQGGDSPGVLIGALSMQIGQAVNPALMRDPQAFASAVARLRAWDAVAPAGYDPGWEHGPPPPAAQVRATADKLKRETLEPAENMARLLAMPDYFEAFKTLQDFNLDPAQMQPSPERVAAARKAERTMADIEKRLGIPGLYTRPGGPSSLANAPDGAAPADPRAAQPARPVGGGIAQPKRLRFVQPKVPADLPPDVPRLVELEVTVDAGGRVTEATVLKGHPAVDGVVAQALRQWVYEPTRVDGKPVPVSFKVTVNLR